MKSLVREGVEVVFGIPGIQIYGIIAALRDEPGIRMITTRHEQATTYMADGYARASGKPGVALVVPGTGLYNAAAGLATAYARSSPVLLIAGQVPRDRIGKNLGAVHEVLDQPDVVRPVTKWQRRALRPREIPEAVFEAFRQMRTGRPRPVLIEVPPEVGVEREEVVLRNPAPVSRIVPSPEQHAGGRPCHRPISPAPDLRRRRSGAIRRRTSSRQTGRSNKHPGDHVQRRQGHHARQPSAVLWLLFQPSGRETGDEPALRGDGGRRRRDRNRHPFFAGQSGRRGIHVSEHQHRRHRTHTSPVQHHPLAWRCQSDYRGLAALPHRGRGGRAPVARRSGQRGSVPDRLLRHQAQGAAVPDSGDNPEQYPGGRFHRLGYHAVRLLRPHPLPSEAPQDVHRLRVLIQPWLFLPDRAGREWLNRTAP